MKDLLRDLFESTRYGDLTLEQRKLYHREWKRRNRDSERAKYHARKDEINARRRETLKDPAAAAAKREYMAGWAAKNRHRFAEYDRRYRLKSEYGISIEQYEAMFAGQGGRCAICDSASSGRWHEALVVDHDHFTGTVRALLCHQCNMVLGHSGDDPAVLRRAADYVERHRAEAQKVG